jgi:hypothetical protein
MLKVGISQQLREEYLYGVDDPMHDVVSRPDHSLFSPSGNTDFPTG